MTSRTWQDGTGLPLSAAQLNAMETDIQKGIDALAGLAGKAPTANPTFTGTVSGVTKAHVGLGSVDNTSDAGKPVSTAQAAAIATAIDAVVKADAAGTYRIIACTLRNTGSGFAILNDSAHEPIGVTSVTTAGDSMSLTLNYSFTATQVGALIVTADDTLANLGYVFGSSVGLSSAVINCSQPGGFADYVSYNGTAWTSMNGYVTSTTMNGTTGQILMNHQDIVPISGQVDCRSWTYRGVTDSLGSNTTSAYLVNTSGVTLKTANSTDCKLWVTRAGARSVPMTELVQTNSNIWVFGIMRTN